MSFLSSLPLTPPDHHRYRAAITAGTSIPRAQPQQQNSIQRSTSLASTAFLSSSESAGPEDPVWSYSVQEINKTADLLSHFALPPLLPTGAPSQPCAATVDSTPSPPPASQQSASSPSPTSTPSPKTVLPTPTAPVIPLFPGITTPSSAPFFAPHVRARLPDGTPTFFDVFAPPDIDTPSPVRLVRRLSFPSLPAQPVTSMSTTWNMPQVVLEEEDENEQGSLGLRTPHGQYARRMSDSGLAVTSLGRPLGSPIALLRGRNLSDISLHDSSCHAQSGHGHGPGLLEPGPTSAISCHTFGHAGTHSASMQVLYAKSPVSAAVSGRTSPVGAASSATHTPLPGNTNSLLLQHTGPEQQQQLALALALDAKLIRSPEDSPAQGGERPRRRRGSGGAAMGGRGAKARIVPRRPVPPVPVLPLGLPSLQDIRNAGADAISPASSARSAYADVSDFDALSPLSRREAAAAASPLSEAELVRAHSVRRNSGEPLQVLTTAGSAGATLLMAISLARSDSRSSISSSVDRTPTAPPPRPPPPHRRRLAEGSSGGGPRRNASMLELSGRSGAGPGAKRSVDGLRAQPVIPSRSSSHDVAPAASLFGGGAMMTAASSMPIPQISVSASTPAVKQAAVFCGSVVPGPPNLSSGSSSSSNPLGPQVVERSRSLSQVESWDRLELRQPQQQQQHRASASPSPTPSSMAASSRLSRRLLPRKMRSWTNRTATTAVQHQQQQRETGKVRPVPVSVPALARVPAPTAVTPTSPSLSIVQPQCSALRRSSSSLGILRLLEPIKSAAAAAGGAGAASAGLKYTKARDSFQQQQPRVSMQSQRRRSSLAAAGASLDGEAADAFLPIAVISRANSLVLDREEAEQRERESGEGDRAATPVAAAAAAAAPPASPLRPRGMVSMQDALAMGPDLVLVRDRAVAVAVANADEAMVTATDSAEAADTEVEQGAAGRSGRSWLGMPAALRSVRSLASFPHLAGAGAGAGAGTGATPRKVTFSRPPQPMPLPTPPREEEGGQQQATRAKAVNYDMMLGVAGALLAMDQRPRAPRQRQRSHSAGWAAQKAQLPAKAQIVLGPPAAGALPGILLKRERAETLTPQALRLPATPPLQEREVAVTPPPALPAKTTPVRTPAGAPMLGLGLGPAFTTPSPSATATTGMRDIAWAGRPELILDGGASLMMSGGSTVQRLSPPAADLRRAFWNEDDERGSGSRFRRIPPQAGRPGSSPSSSSSLSRDSTPSLGRSQRSASLSTPPRNGQGRAPPSTGAGTVSSAGRFERDQYTWLRMQEAAASPTLPACDLAGRRGPGAGLGFGLEDGGGKRLVGGQEREAVSTIPFPRASPAGAAVPAVLRSPGRANRRSVTKAATALVLTLQRSPSLRGADGRATPSPRSSSRSSILTTPPPAPASPSGSISRTASPYLYPYLVNRHSALLRQQGGAVLSEDGDGGSGSESSEESCQTPSPGTALRTVPLPVPGSPSRAGSKGAGATAGMEGVEGEQAGGVYTSAGVVPLEQRYRALEAWLQWTD